MSIGPRLNLLTSLEVAPSDNSMMRQSKVENRQGNGCPKKKRPAKCYRPLQSCFTLIPLCKPGNPHSPTEPLTVHASPSLATDGEVAARYADANRIACDHVDERGDRQEKEDRRLRLRDHEELDQAYDENQHRQGMVEQRSR